MAPHCIFVGAHNGLTMRQGTRVLLVAPFFRLVSLGWGVVAPPRLYPSVSRECPSAALVFFWTVTVAIGKSLSGVWQPLTFRHRS